MNDFASFAASPRPPHTAVAGCYPASQQTSGDISPIAMTTNQTPAPVGLQRRALRMFPHKKLARQRYLRAHDDLLENLTQIRGL